MKTKAFKAESKRLLDMMIHSIYTHREIFLRELISNASDAIDKLYYRSLSEDITGLSRNDFAINLAVDKDARTLTLSDNGCGMSREELESNLGTIAKSGSLAFKQENTEHGDAVDIIGQFGVGFYSAFMVSSHVTVTSRQYGSDEAFCWESSGVEGYTIEPCEMDGHGTKIVLEIKANDGDENYDEFLQPHRVSSLVKKYSDYIRYPIRMDMPTSKLKEGCPEDKPEYEQVDVNETLNSMTPIWKKTASEVTDDELNAFYKEKFFDFEDSARIIRSSTEGAATYNALMFIPSRAPFNYYSREYEKGLQLFASGVLIMDKCADLLPDCFSFVRGLVDSQDLSLNISREMLQHDRQLKIIAGRLEKKIHSELLAMLQNDREKYDAFWKNFGLQIKYGVYGDYGAKKDLLQDLMMFHSSEGEKPVTLSEYVGRMKESQKYIYYACGETVEKIARLPQTELLSEQGFEILYLTDDVDEFALKVLRVFEEKEFRSVSDKDLGLDTEAEKEEVKKQNDDNKELLDFLTESLGGSVKAVRLSGRLKSHPVCLSSDGSVSLEMEKVLSSMPGAEGGAPKAERVLEINASHPLFAAMQQLFSENRDKVKDYASMLYTQALLIEGMPIDDPVAFSNLVCGLMSE